MTHNVNGLLIPYYCIPVKVKILWYLGSIDQEENNDV